MLITIDESSQGQRLDKFLVRFLNSLSRSQVQKAIENKDVLLNDKETSKHSFLRASDKLQIKDELLKPAAIFKILPNSKIKLSIIFEDINYLIVNKPANLIVHPSAIHQSNDTLINGLLAYYPKIKNIGEDPWRPGIVHRLDKDVSGVMVIAKSNQAYKNLKEQFQNRTIYKEYLTLAHGKFPQKHGFINFNIERSKIAGHKMAARPDDSGREALTEYEVIREFNDYALLKIILHTGRTHQIRVHLNAIGHPIVGEPLYKPKSFKCKLKLNRIFLHSHIIKFTNTANNDVLTFCAEMPNELTQILNNL